MLKKLLLLPILSGLLLFTQKAKSQCTELVWSDEFNYTGLPDPNKWGYDVGAGGYGNNELQNYTEDRLDNGRVEDGSLIIEALLDNFEDTKYSSARLVSRDQGDWLYGRIEIRAKIPSGRGSWPAIWMLPTDREYGGWPRSGEIDIMEHVGYDQGKVHATVHTEAYNHQLGTQVGKSIFDDNIKEEYHNYIMEWDEDNIQVYLDDLLFFNFGKEEGGSAVWPFDKRFHLLLNVAIGGDWGGAQGIDDTMFEQEDGVKMYVDYVRVYQNSENLTIYGDKSVVEGEAAINYSIPAAEGSSYNWSVPTGSTILTGEMSNEITVDWGCTPGAVTCQYITECSTYNLTLDVTLESIKISGDTLASQGDQSLSFQVPEVANATYTWTVPATATISEGQGSNEIAVDWGSESGAVSVNINSNCSEQTDDISVEFIVQSPYPENEQPHVIPGTINSVDYDQGGEGVSYHDTDPTNVGTGDRMDEAVDTEKGDNGNGNVGWVAFGEWLEYTVAVASAGTYEVKARVATQVSDAGSFTVSFNNGTSLTSDNIGITGGWTSFEEISLGEVLLDESVTEMTITFNGSSFNVSDVILEVSGSSGVLSTDNSAIEQVSIYPNPATNNELMLSGNIDSYHTISITSFSGKEVINVNLQAKSNKASISIATLPRGIYLVELRGSSQSKTMKLVRQ